MVGEDVGARREPFPAGNDSLVQEISNRSERGSPNQTKGGSV